MYVIQERILLSQPTLERALEDLPNMRKARQAIVIREVNLKAFWKLYKQRYCRRALHAILYVSKLWFLQ